MKKTNILYWVFTGLFSFLMVGSGIQHIIMHPQSVQGFSELQLPTYLLPFLGWAKLLGVIAILVPGYPRIKEWAYAGLQFDLIGAIYAIASIGKPIYMWAPMFVFVGLGFASYVFYHKRLQEKTARQNQAGLLQTA